LGELLRHNLVDRAPLISLDEQAVWVSRGRVHLLNAGAFLPAGPAASLQHRRALYGAGAWRLARAYFDLLRRGRDPQGGLDAVLPARFRDPQESFAGFQRALDGNAFRLDEEAVELRLRLLQLARSLGPKLALPVPCAVPRALPDFASLNSAIRDGRLLTGKLDADFQLDPP